jgi:hypothetical protein
MQKITGGFQMQLKKHPWLTAAILLAVGLAACNAGKVPQPTTDANAVYTSVASTMIAQLNDQLTQTAQAVPAAGLVSPTELLPTLPPLPTLEATVTPFGTLNVPGSPTLVTVLPPASTSSSTAAGCADSLFIADITIPDGTVVKPGAVFQKIWRMKNSGTCKWISGFKFAFAYGGSRFGGADSTINQTNDFVPVDGTKDFGVKLIAPAMPNTYSGCWKMQTNQGYWFGQAACVTFKVSK